MGSKGALAATLGVVLFMGHPGARAVQQKTESAAESEPHYKCDTDGVGLEGTLTERTFYGPPGFGETPAKDARERVLILRLPKPVTIDPIEDVKANNGTCWSSFPNLKAIQLLILPLEKATDARKLVGKTVVVVGRLQEGDAPSEHTKVTMDVKKLDPK
jgi:hypothetical protein